MEPAVSENVLEVLTPEQCLRLLRTQAIGRLWVGRGDRLPLVVPVNYVVDDDDVVVFRTAPGSKLARLRDEPVTFEVDSVDGAHRLGWSVLVQGLAVEATAEEVRFLFLEPWAPGPKEVWVRVLPAVISGRALVPPDPPAGDSRGYL